MYTLVVVDMQADFNAANGERVTNNCLREIKKAKKDKAAIIFLEYSGSGKTHAVLLNETKGYKNSFVRIKRNDDGSKEVYNTIYAGKLQHKLIKVCGVNTDCCVKLTVQGLTERYPYSNIEVIMDACHSDWYHNAGIESMKKMPNVSVKKG